MQQQHQNELQRNAERFKREERLARMRSMTAWGLTAASVAGLFGVYHAVSANTLKKPTETAASPTLPTTVPKMTKQPALTRTSEPQSTLNTLRLGSQGESVKSLQENLAKLGYFTIGYFTDYYGPTTERAVRRFQVQNGLNGTGIADPATLQRIYREAHAAQTATASLAATASATPVHKGDSLTDSAPQKDRSGTQSTRTGATAQSSGLHATRSSTGALQSSTESAQKPVVVTRGS